MRAIIMVVAASVVAFAANPAGQQPTRTGTLIVAHGGGEEWNAQVFEVVRRVRTGGPVEIGFLMGPAAAKHRFQDAVDRLETAGVARIVVVPLLVSSHSGHYEQIRYLAGERDDLNETMLHHLHMAGIERASTTLPIRVTPAMDDAVQIARVLADRSLALAEASPEQALMLVGHGPNSAEDLAAWMDNLRTIADSVRSFTGFRDVRVGLVQDDAPPAVRAEAVRRVRELIQLQAIATGRDVVAVPVLVSKGLVSHEKLPADLAGLPVRYGGDPILPHDGVARWIESRVEAAVAGTDR